MGFQGGSRGGHGGDFPARGGGEKIAAVVEAAEEDPEKYGPLVKEMRSQLRIWP